MSASISAVVLPLVGVLLGTAGTLTGQYLATRGDTRRHAAALAAAARAERKQAIVDFLAAAQRVEQVIDNAAHRAQPTDDTAVDELLHQLWLAKKLVELVCGHELASAAHDFTSTLENMARGNRADLADLSDRQRTARSEFMESARHELGVTGPRLYPVGTAPRAISSMDAPDADRQPTAT
jgi:hypothetical protein